MPATLYQIDSAARDLPVADVLPALLDTLARGRNAVLVAPPGAGKTTLAPLALLDAPWLGAGRIVVLEPRRLAARAAASRMAHLLGEAVGGTAGFRTRLDSAVGPATRIEVVTEGLLVRRLAGSDPGLDGVGCVVLDEVHERSLDADLALAFLLDLQRQLRPELRLLAMSATADGARLSALMDADVIESAGRMFPVAVEHAARDVVDARDLPDAMARAVRAALSAHRGDLLCFLPGVGEIRRTEAALAGCGAPVLPLYGDLAPAEQDRALRPAEGQRRVVLATSIAETSLTVPGVRVVIDGGWRRVPRLDVGSGLTRLATVRISRAAADQRAGRAGREAPGAAVRLWTPAMHRGLPAFDRPEILDAELSGLALDCAAWGTPPSALPFPDPPPAGALAAAHELLAEMGAVADGRLTALGARMAGLGAHPRLAAMMLTAEAPETRALAADLAALLEERDPLRLEDADIARRLAAIARGDGPFGRIRRAAAQYRRRLGTGGTAGGDPAPLIAAAFPDRIAQRRGEPGSFRLSGGGSAKLATADPLARAKLLAVAALDGSGSPRIRLAAELDPARLPPQLAARVTETRETLHDVATGAVTVRTRRRLGALVLEDRLGPADPGHAARLQAEAAARDLRLLPWTDAARALQARAGLLRAVDPALADLSDDALRADAAAWLEPHLHGARLASLDLAALLRERLGWADAARLDRELPTHIALPGGRAVVDYGQPVPVASARAQAFYGLSDTPVLAGGRVKLRLALLSPAGRPIAMTGDLGAFWRGAWADARRDMRGRYPRHDWPEHPGASQGR